MSRVELARAALERIAAREPEIHAYAHLDRDAALAEARRLDAEGADGPLSGHVVAIKDIFDTADMPTGRGSPIYGGHRPPRDAAAVAAIRQAGGLVIGKAVTTEFAHLTPGPTRNPHDTTRTPGGSSSGSAATVAAGGATLATGTQTAGSIIRPAAYCGVVGYKPSFATISRSGLALFGETLDTIGGFAASVADAALFIGAMAGRPDLSAAGAAEHGGPPRLAIWPTPAAGEAEDPVREALEQVATAAARAGATVVPLAAEAGWWWDLLEAQQTVMAREGAQALAWERTARRALLSDPLRAYLDDGAEVSAPDYLAALAVRQETGGRLFEAMAPFDAVLTLSAPGEAPLAATGTGDPRFNRVWTLLGGPALHLPTGTGPSGLPVGVQLTAPPGADARLLSAARWLEARRA